jgi:hypothetical protein
MGPKQKTEEHLRSRRQLAQRWACSIETVKRRERSGLLPVIKIGTHARYRASDIEAIEIAAPVK